MTESHSSEWSNDGRERQTNGCGKQNCFCFNCRGQQSADRRAALSKAEQLWIEGRGMPAEAASRVGLGSLPRAAAEAGDEWASDSPPYLESNRNSVEQKDGEEKTWFELRSCGCRLRFCPRCCVSKGIKLRQRVGKVVQTFTGMQMWTLTIDPQLFASPAEAFDYVRKKRCVAEWVRSLRHRGLLHSGRFFCVVEWQKETEMPHFHVLLDASFIPFETACDLWNRFRPVAAGPVAGERPGFGSVRFSVPKFADAQHAAAYACKYMIKHPEHGYPDWVLDSRGEIKRYSTSKGFWTGHLGDAFEDGTGNTGFHPEQIEAVDQLPEETQTPERSTIRERLARCGKTAVVLEVAEVGDANGETRSKRKFLYKLGTEFTEALRRLGVDEQVANAIRLKPWEVADLLQWEGDHLQGTGEGEAWVPTVPYSVITQKERKSDESTEDRRRGGGGASLHVAGNQGTPGPE